eukprot:TRINITY_DN3966_c0_g1_i3.p2 TRINITY_DN3966_c0_g1~~TRINITY_DN3966_c0_g1_i3.p2  ORF type:complete len:347 (-),score=44.88 TRINITY_DN3966_c0_g1_i3:1425-2465(-)
MLSILFLLRICFLLSLWSSLSPSPSSSSPSTSTSLIVVAAMTPSITQDYFGNMNITTPGSAVVHVNNDIIASGNASLLAVASAIRASPFYRGFYNVVAYGATGQDASDDTAAFQAAIAALTSKSQGGTLYIPAGNYYISNTLSFDGVANSNLRILGDSYKTSILRWVHDGVLLNITQNVAQGYLISDIWITPTANKSASSYAIYSPYFDRSTIRDIQILSVSNIYIFIGGGILAGNSVSKHIYLTIHNVHIAYMAYTGITLINTAEVTISHTSIFGQNDRQFSLNSIYPVGIHVGGACLYTYIETCSYASLRTGLLFDNSFNTNMNTNTYISSCRVDFCSGGIYIL